MPADEEGQYKGHGHGDDHASAEDGAAPGHVRGNMLGESCLDGAGTEGKADSEDRMYHIVYAQSLRTNGPGQKNPIEKA